MFFNVLQWKWTVSHFGNEKLIVFMGESASSPGTIAKRLASDT